MPRPLPMTGLALASVVALAAGLGPRPAAAQPVRFCDGSLVVNSAYTTVLPGSRGGAQVEYHVLLQNRDAGGRRIGVQVLDIAPVGRVSFTRLQAAFTLDAGSQSDLALATLQVPGGGGAGAPGTAQFLQALKLNCRLL